MFAGVCLLEEHVLHVCLGGVFSCVGVSLFVLVCMLVVVFC